MSAPPGSPRCERPLTVFRGSSPGDVSHARQLWSSLSLLPPLESRLVSADIRQRLPVSRPQRSGCAGAGAGAGAAGPRPPAPRPPSPQRGLEERRRYAAMAEQRREILALLRRQRELRIQKELPSAAFKPQPRSSRDQVLGPHGPSGWEQEQVKQLQ